MIGIVMLSHGNFAKEAVESSILLAGNQPNVTAIGLYHGDSPETMSIAIQQNINAVDQGEGVLVLVDFFGGTPANEAMKLIESYNIQVVSGFNLGMLLEVLMRREHTSLVELTNIAITSGISTIIDMNKRYQQVKNQKGGDKIG